VLGIFQIVSYFRNATSLAGGTTKQSAYEKFLNYKPDRFVPANDESLKNNSRQSGTGTGI